MPADIATLSALKARVEAATGPDRDLDGDIYAVQQGWDAAHWGSYSLERLKLQSRDGDRYTYGFSGESADHDEVPYFTASVDDALDLSKAVLPEWSLNLLLGEGYRHPCAIMGRSYPTNARVAVEHHTAPLVILAAVIAALAEASHAR